MKGNTTARPSVRQRGGSRKANRLQARIKAHQEFPVNADGKQWSSTRLRAKAPGSTNPAKH